MKKIFILGASGSIGENALSVIDSNKEKFELVGISVNSNVEKANQIIKKYNPKYIYISDKSAKKNILEIEDSVIFEDNKELYNCLLYTSPSPRDRTRSRMPSSA